jgi:RimJ/RimL family protein N-acetyltransferase
MEQMAEFHPQEPHWYLPLLGVDPMKQGRGYGSALLVHALERCDRDRLPAYLEASSPRNKALYERHGFVGDRRHPGRIVPPMWPMLAPGARRDDRSPGWRLEERELLVGSATGTAA